MPFTLSDLANNCLCNCHALAARRISLQKDKREELYHVVSFN